MNDIEYIEDAPTKGSLIQLNSIGCDHQYPIRRFHSLNDKKFANHAGIRWASTPTNCKSFPW